MESYTVYILHSESADKYYIGYTADIEKRLHLHNDPYVESHASILEFK